MIINYDQIPKLVETSLEVKIGRESLNVSKTRTTSIGTSFIPEVSLYAIGEDSKIIKMNEEPSAGVVATLNLFNGFKDVEQKNVHKFTYDTKKLEFQKSYNELIFQTQKYFIMAMKSQENLKALNEYNQINKGNRDLILRKVRTGLSPKSEELIFKKIELELQEKISKEENDLKIAYVNLRQILSLKREENLEIRGSLDVSSYQYIKNSKKIDLSIAESSESVLNSEKKMSGLWRMPKVDFYAEQSFTNHVNGEFLDEADNRKQVFGLRLVMPLVSGKNFDSIEDQVKRTEIESALLRKKYQLSQSEANDEKIQIQLDNLLNTIEVSRNKIKLSKEIMDKTFNEFKIGLKEAVSLNEATSAYIDAKQDFIDHQVDYILGVEETKVSSIIYDN